MSKNMVICCVLVKKIKSQYFARLSPVYHLTNLTNLFYWGWCVFLDQDQSRIVYRKKSSEASWGTWAVFNWMFSFYTSARLSGTCAVLVFFSYCFLFIFFLLFSFYTSAGAWRSGISPPLCSESTSLALKFKLLQIAITSKLFPLLSESFCFFNTSAWQIGISPPFCSKSAS